MKSKLLLVLLLAGNCAFAADWEVKRDKNGIVVETRDVAGSKHRQVRAEMTVQSRLSSLFALVSDTDRCNELTKLCRESTIVEQLSETELIVYSYNDIPWPVKDRDAVTRVIWTQDPDTLSVSMTANAIEGNVPETKAVRIKTATTRWDFIPLQDGQVRVVSIAHVDPEGPTPAWLTNLLLVDAPYDTLVNMRDILATGRYDAAVSFITEP